MQVSVETTTTDNILKCQLTVGVPRERIEPEIQSRLRSLARTVKFNGFRPGKVPLRVVEQKYGTKVRQEVIGEVIQTSFSEALQQENLRPIGQPMINFDREEQNFEQGLTYTATFEIYPEIPPIKTDGLVIEKPTAVVQETDIDTMLQKLRGQRQTWYHVDTPAALGDKVIINLVGTINGEAYKGNEIKSLPLILGKSNFILPGLEESLLGIRAGDSREVELTLPQDYKNPELAGKVIHFRVYANSVATPQLPPLDTEFAKALGVEDGNLETLRQDARANMERELHQAIQSRIKQQALQALLNVNPINISKSLVDEEAQRLAQKMLQNLQIQGKYAGEFNLTPEMFKEEAEKRVKLGLLVSEVVKVNNIQVQPERVRQMIDKLSYNYEDPEAVVNWYYADRQRLAEIEGAVLEEQVVEWLLERAEIIEKPTDFYTLMAYNQDKIAIQ